MSQSNENYIKELEKKLHWYTYEANEEEFNEDEVMKICRILNQIDPIPVDTGKGIEKIVKRIQEKIKLSNNENTNDILVNIERIKYSIRKEKNLIAANKREKSGGIPRILIGVACVLIIFVSVNAATYATKEKSFFETTLNPEQGFSVVVNGHVDAENSFNKQQEKTYETWEQLQKTEEEIFLEPNYLPKSMKLDHISKTEKDACSSVFVGYKNNVDDLYLQIVIEIFGDDYIFLENTMKENWVILDKDIINGIELLYYQEAEETFCYFNGSRSQYLVSTDGGYEELKLVVESMLAF